jgi:hypothetical protein
LIVERFSPPEIQRLRARNSNFASVGLRRTGVAPARYRRVFQPIHRGAPTVARERSPASSVAALTVARLAPRLSLPAPQTGLPEPTAAKSVDEEVLEREDLRGKTKMAEMLIGV